MKTRIGTNFFRLQIHIAAFEQSFDDFHFVVVFDFGQRNEHDARITRVISQIDITNACVQNG